MNEIVLAGCSPTPLASYLKGLGVLRLLTQPFPSIRAAWSGNQLVITADMEKADIEEFLLREYSPTPILSPWNSGSGFYFQERKSNEKDPTTGKKIKLGIRDQPTAATQALDTIVGSKSGRLSRYRNAAEVCWRLIKHLDYKEAPETGTNKDQFILSLRGALPDDCLEWMDAALVVTSGKTRFPPLLGTGGNDGNLDFTTNFMQRLGDVFDPSSGAPIEQSANWLQMALDGTAAPGLQKRNIGQFSPGQAGGPNGTTGFEADSAINPWDFILMIEGALPFAAAAVRRNADDPEGALSYPFTVRAVGAGSGGLGEGDAASTRGELWMPLWRRPASYPEVRALLAEGRVALGRKPARDALDFIRAVHRLGSYRGVDSFQRYGLLMRSGKAYLATPLDRVEVSNEPNAQWLDDLDQQDWLARFRRFAQGETVSRHFIGLRRRLEDALFGLAGHTPAPTEVQALLVLLGEINTALGTSKKARDLGIKPVPVLSEHWVAAAEDHVSPAFRIARALAGLRGAPEAPLPIRAQIFPIHPRYNIWSDEARRSKNAANDPACRLRLCDGTKATLIGTLIALLGRRLWLAEQLGMRDATGAPMKPLKSASGINLDDLLLFLRDDRHDQDIASLLPGLSLCDIPRDLAKNAGDGAAPAAFALLKLCLTPDTTLRHLNSGSAKRLGEKDHLPVPSGMLAQLAAGNADNRAVRLAWRRLTASGLSPLPTRDSLPELGAINPRRAAAALLIPLNFGASDSMARSVLKHRETEPA